jgi:transcriptional regulator with XRE-family HTH domain
MAPAVRSLSQGREAASDLATCGFDSLIKCLVNGRAEVRYSSARGPEGTANQKARLPSKECTISPAAPTIADVARVAQVDKSTVSRALNGTGRVSEETRQRIIAAATELGYRPSRLAQGFRSGSSTTIGVVIGSLSDPGTTDLVSGVLEISDPAGYSILLAESLREGSTPPRSLDFPIDGVSCPGRTRSTAAASGIAGSPSSTRVPAGAAHQATSIRQPWRRIGHWGVLAICTSA